MHNALGQIGGVDAAHIKDVLIILGFLASATASIFSLLHSKKLGRLFSGDDNQSEVVSKDFCASQHTSLGTRLEHIEKQITDIRVEASGDREAFSDKLLSQISGIQSEMTRILSIVSEMRGEFNEWRARQRHPRP